MNPNHDRLADRVWEEIRPALRRHRRLRRFTAVGALATVLGLSAVVSLSGLRRGAPEPPLAAPSRPDSPSADHPSLAVLVVDHTGARFAQLRADEIASQGLSPNFSLDPVVTTPFADVY